jgi:hypothetical protein
MHPILALVTSRGHLVRTAELVAHGFSSAMIRHAVARGVIIRVCHGWVGTGAANQLAVIAVSHRGTLTGPSALASRGTWDAVDKRLHILVPPNSHGAPLPLRAPLASFAAPRFPPGAIERHWDIERAPDATEPRWRSSVIDALRIVALTAPDEQYIACVESALHEKTLPRAAIPALRASLPLRLRHLCDALEPRSGSGLETIVRLRATPLARRIDVQVAVPGISRRGGDGEVDLVIDEWLVIEVDGDEHHDSAADRIRNGVLVRFGYRWHRFGYAQILFDWPSVEATIVELLRYPPGGRHTRSREY